MLSEITERITDKIPQPVITLAGFLADIATIVTAIGVPSGLFYFEWKFSEEKLATVIASNLPEIILSLIIIRILWQQMKRKKEHRMHQKIINENYYKLLHDCRNVINEMEKYYKKEELNLQLLSHLIKDFAENTLNYLTDTLGQMSGKKICGCVKVIVGDGFETISYRDACVKTFVRSSNSETSRKTMDENPAFQIVKINENTDFMSIVAEDRTGNDSVFYQQDLIAFNKQLEKIGDRYRNTTLDWDKYYKATIVVPIRIANKRFGARI